MNRDDIIRIARECGLHLGGPPLESGLARFAALVAATEREACETACKHQPHWVACVAAIRARGGQT